MELLEWEKYDGIIKSKNIKEIYFCRDKDESDNPTSDFCFRIIINTDNSWKFGDYIQGYNIEKFCIDDKHLQGKDFDFDNVILIIENWRIFRREKELKKILKYSKNIENEIESLKSLIAKITKEKNENK